MSNRTDDLLRVLIAVTGRAAIPPDELRALVTGGKPNAKQVQAYNLCDGDHAQADIARALTLDRSNFNKMVKRWEQLGIAFRIGEDDNPLHLYPLT